MKKLFVLTLAFSAFTATALRAQSNQVAMQQQAKETKPQATTSAPADDAAMLQQAKDRIRPQMVEKTGLTAAQADRVVELNFEMRQAARAFKDLGEEERRAKIAELKAAKEKKFAEFLTADQIKAVYAFYEEMGKNMPPKAAN